MSLPIDYYIVCDYPGHPTEESARATLDEVVSNLPLVGIFLQSTFDGEVPVWTFSNLDESYFTIRGWTVYIPN